MIVLITDVIAGVYTMQIISQSNRLDFLPPDVAPADSGAARAVLHDALIYRRGRKERWGGLRDVCELVCVEAGVGG